MLRLTRTLERSVAAGIDWLRLHQGADGSFPSYSSSLLDEPTWEPDHPNFVTALTSLALCNVEGDDAVAMRRRAAGYLSAEREHHDLWRYWARSSELHDYTPLDVDDTACCSLAVRNGSSATNVPILLANRDAAGRFYTWLLPRPGIRALRHRWALRDERRAAVRERRAELWANSEASPDDVDVTVNANVIRYLGAELAPVEAVEWVAEVVEAGTEIEDDRWYRSRTSLYRSVAVSAVGGVARFAELRDVILARLLEDPGPSAFRDDLELADALQVLHLLRAPVAERRSMAAELLGRQRDDGSWERSMCYFGGPQESFGWASEALATAAAVAALQPLVGAGDGSTPA